MKKAITASLFIFWAVVTAILTAGLVFYGKGQNASPGANSTGTQPAASVSLGPTGTLTLNMAEVAKHNKASDCWMVINNKVYVLTQAISTHPGGAASIITFCGQDGTQAFATKDLNPSRAHSSFADNLLNNYYLGDLNQTLTGQQLNSAQTNINSSTSSNANSLGENEREND